MDPRAASLIASLGMTPHPEGGFFREVFRSGSRVKPLDTRPDRPALTTIFFLLTSTDVSRWHRVGSDEVWHYYEGADLELLTADGGLAHVTRHVLGPVGGNRQPVHVVPAHAWQAARSTGEYTLVGCTVGPGFEFDDFEMLRQRPADVETAKRRHPYVAGLI